MIISICFKIYFYFFYDSFDFIVDYDEFCFIRKMLLINYDGIY